MAARRKSGNTVAKYIAASVILGVVEGIVTFYFLSTAALSPTNQGSAFVDPVNLAPYILGMLLLSLITLLIFVGDQGINVMPFVTFVLVWLFVGALLFYVLV